MTLQTSARRWYDAMSWNVRGVFATEANRRVGFWVRNLLQPREVLARKRMAHDVVAPRELQIPDADSYLRLPASSMPDLRAVCDAGRTTARASLDDTNHPGGKGFHRNHLANPDHIAALLRIALDPRMIAMATSYLGLVPILMDADYFLSRPSSPPWSKSQLWHCDDDAPHHLKLFIYCNDVGEQDGPFDLIPALDSYRVRRAVGYRYAGRRYRVSDATMDQHVPRDNQLSILGPAGSAFIIDTVRCFHRGSRIVDPARYRMVAFIHYCPPNAARLPLRLATRGAPFANQIEQYSGELERAVLGCPVAAS
jgi:hypothetical protein